MELAIIGISITAFAVMFALSYGAYQILSIGEE